MTDNDALDFAFQYDQELFPNVPVVFVGIPNPEEYPLEGSLYYGLKETGSSEFVLPLIRSLFPDSKRLLVIADKTTTGLIYRKEFTLEAKKFDHLSVIFPEVVELDSIYGMVSSGTGFDAVFYAGISQDKKEKLIDRVSVVQKICELSKVPVFTNDPLGNGTGILGGLFRNGKQQGAEAVSLLIKLLNTTSRDSIKHIYTTSQRYFFDGIQLEKYLISEKQLPAGSVVFHRKTFFTKEHFVVLLSILGLLFLVIAFLIVKNRKSKLAHQRSEKQLHETKVKKDELEEAYGQLAQVLDELEKTNADLKESNIKLNEARKKAEESDNLKSAFLANMSHEIRTPLNSIVGFSSLLNDPKITEEKRNVYINLVESNTESLLVLIDEILDLSKIEAQQLTLDMQEFSIDELISELFLIFKRTKSNPHIELKVGTLIKGKSLSVCSDRVRVKQIITNLLSNALKYTDSGFVEIGYMLGADGEVCLYVRDTGIGISPEYHQAIFQRFRKLEEDPNRLSRGTGLGLAITQKLVELLGGKIWLESEPGKGSVFYFTLNGFTLKDVPR